MEQKVAHLNLGEKLWVWFEASKKQVLWGAIIVVVVGLIVSYYLWQEGEKELQAGQALSQALAGAAFSGGPRADSADAYLKMASQYSGTSAAGQALLLAGETFFTAGKYSEAQAQFQRFVREYSGHPLVPQALLGTAACLNAQGKTDEAARAYKELSERYAASNVAGPAKLALARIYESQNQIEQARNLYQELVRGESSLSMEAGMRLDALRTKLAATSPAPEATSLPLLSVPKTN